MIIIHTIHRPLNPTEQMILRSMEQAMHKDTSETCEPAEFVELARAQWPAFPALADALAQCGNARRLEDTILFCDPGEAYEREPIGCLYLQHEKLGELSLALVADESTAIGFKVERIELPAPMHEVMKARLPV